MSKGTAVHAKVLAFSSTDFYSDDPEHVEEIPDFSESDTIALFPSETSKTLDEIDLNFLKGVKRVVVVEGTWVKSHAAIQRAKINHLVHVKLKPHQSLFWRYQGSNTYDGSKLSSIEAIFYFFEEWLEKLEHDPQVRDDQLKKLKDLLFLFAWQRSLVQSRYCFSESTSRKLVGFKRKAPTCGD